AVRADDPQLEGPDEAQVLDGVVAGGRAADEDRAAEAHGAQGGRPRVATGEVDDDVDAALAGEAVGLAVVVLDPGEEVLLAVVDRLVGADLAELGALLVRAGGGDDVRAELLGED